VGEVVQCPGNGAGVPERSNRVVEVTRIRGSATWNERVKAPKLGGVRRGAGYADVSDSVSERFKSGGGG
jgi:hypothetical protein